MCCFSQPVELVSNTNIFARPSVGNRQFLVYSMTYAASEELAMVLPLPVPIGSGEDAVRFINLNKYKPFFADLKSGFPKRMLQTRSGSGDLALLAAAPLEVQDVGDFEASFVPTVADFSRLAPRFQIPASVWQRLPSYQDFGFAVFKLKATTGLNLVGKMVDAIRSVKKTAEPKPVQPMAFEFPRRNSDLLYFPTVHIHDGEVHSSAGFDHMLYCQPGPGQEQYLDGWEQSQSEVSEFAKADCAEGILDPSAICWRYVLEGNLENKDTLVGAGGQTPRLPN